LFWRCVELAVTVSDFTKVNDFAENWVQVNGDQSNNLITPAQIKMKPRWGSAYVVRQQNFTQAGIAIPENERFTLFVVGGDTHDFDSGGTGYMNDVWALQDPC